MERWPGKVEAGVGDSRRAVERALMALEQVQSLCSSEEGMAVAVAAVVEFAVAGIGVEGTFSGHVGLPMNSSTVNRPPPGAVVV